MLADGKAISCSYAVVAINCRSHSHDSRIEGYKEKLFRIRVGDYRILYEVNHKGNLIGIVKIDKR